MNSTRVDSSRAREIEDDEEEGGPFLREEREGSSEVLSEQAVMADEEEGVESLAGRCRHGGGLSSC